MNCEKNSLLNTNKYWDEDMFLDSDLEGLLSGDVISRVVLHSIKGALSGAKRHKIDARGWNSLLTQYVVGVYCEKQKRNRLFTFKPRLVENVLDEIIGIDVDNEEIEPGELVVLGMDGLGERAWQEYRNAFEENNDVKRSIFTFLNKVIDEVQKDGRTEIDYPSVLRAFNRGTLTELYRKSSDSNA